MMLCVEFFIAEEGFDDVLTIVECTSHCDIVHVGVGDGRHLGFLNGGHAAFWVEDEYFYVGFVSESIDRSALEI